MIADEGPSGGIFIPPRMAARFLDAAFRTPLGSDRTKRLRKKRRAWEAATSRLDRWQSRPRWEAVAPSVNDEPFDDGEVRCPECGAIVAEDADDCPYCGEEM